jgi:small-conductance mechanosensitive channel
MNMLVELLEGLVEALVGGLAVVGVVAIGVLSLPALDAEVLLEVGVEVHAQLQTVDQLRDLGLVLDLLPLLELVQLVGQGLGDLLHVDLLERELLILFVAVFISIFVVAVLFGFLELLLLLLVLLRSFVVQLRQLVGGTGVDLSGGTRELVTRTRNARTQNETLHYRPRLLALLIDAEPQSGLHPLLLVLHEALRVGILSQVLSFVRQKR